MISLIKRLFGRDKDTSRPAKRISPGETAHGGNPSVQTSKPSAADAFDNPDLDIVAPPHTGFDPYNTGTFNRSGSWERINKRRSS